MNGFKATLHSSANEIFRNPVHKKRIYKLYFWYLIICERIQSYSIFISKWNLLQPCAQEKNIKTLFLVYDSISLRSKLNVSKATLYFATLCTRKEYKNSISDICRGNGNPWKCWSASFGPDNFLQSAGVGVFPEGIFSHWYSSG